MRFTQLQSLTETGSSRTKEALRFSDYVVSLTEGEHPMTDEQSDVIMKLGQKLLRLGYKFHSYKESSTGMSNDDYASLDFPRPDWAAYDYDSGAMVMVLGDVHVQVASHANRTSFEHLNAMDWDQFHEAIKQMIAGTNKVKEMLK